MNYKIEEKYNAYSRRQMIIKFNSKAEIKVIDVEINEESGKLELIYGIMTYGEVPLDTQIADDILVVWHKDNSTTCIEN